MTSSRTEKLRFIVYLSVFLLVMVTGTFGFMLVEGLTLASAVYFTIVTIATVGYGDIAPVTDLGRVLAIVLIITGVGTFVGLLANATEIFISRRDNAVRLQKLQMVVGLFFSEAGTRLMRFFSEADKDYAYLAKVLTVKDDWSQQEFLKARNQLDGHLFEVDMQRIDITTLKSLLERQSQLLVRLLESPYMLEHESFTDLLIAVLHLKEELEYREEYLGLPETDRDHLGGDIKRAYTLIVRQWLEYISHLNDSYPFLFSLAMRTNPFDEQASPVIRPQTPAVGEKSPPPPASSDGFYRDRTFHVPEGQD